MKAKKEMIVDTLDIGFHIDLITGGADINLISRLVNHPLTHHHSSDQLRYRKSPIYKQKKRVAICRGRAEEA